VSDVDTCISSNQKKDKISDKDIAIWSFTRHLKLPVSISIPAADVVPVVYVFNGKDIYTLIDSKPERITIWFSFISFKKYDL